MEYHITQYELEQGALEIQYIEEYFGEFPRKKTATEIIERLQGRSHLILLANARVARRSRHRRAGLLQGRARDHDGRNRAEARRISWGGCTSTSTFPGRRVLYTWIGGTRRDWRGQGHFRALTEQQEFWAIEQGFDEIVVKTKNKFYEMRGTLDHLRFEVVKYERQRSRQRRVEGVPEQEAAAGNSRTATAARGPSCRRRSRP